VQIGQVINGKYRIERQIGRGGMGIVLAATHLQLEHVVAIKVMRRDLVVDDKALDRLLMEARSAARIRSEHVARVLDVGTLDNGSPFIVMEYLEGENLADLLDREGALEIEQAASFLMQCCLALAEVHVAEMVHRDLKPGNLFIARLPDGSPTVKIVDFGISKHIGSARDHAATTSPQVLGSPFYMSPEQMRAEPVDERSDIWGLGAILFEMLTGRPPFIGDTLPEVYSAVLNDAPPAVDSLRSGVPGGLDDVVQRCLEKEPAQRFCDVADLAEALAPFVGPASSQSVERITRILMNPDAVRARYSLLPAPAGSAPVLGVSSHPGEPASGMIASGEGVEDSMAGESNGGGAPREQRPSRIDVADGGSGGTWLEPSAPGAEPRERASWRPSRPALSGEFTPLSATGIFTGRVRRAARARLALAAGAVALLAVVGAFWVRGASAPEHETPAVPVVEVVKLTPPPEAAAEPMPDHPVPAQPVAAPSEPRVTPIAADSSDGEGATRDDTAPSRAAVSSAGVSTAQRAKPVPASASVAPAPPRRAPSGSAERTTPTRAQPEREASNEAPPPSRAPTMERPAVAHGDDPWNPDSFGDRR